MELKDKKVLLVGLGVLGGGLAAAKYFLDKGARLTITDLRTREQLKDTLSKLPTGISFTIGEHKKSDFDNADLVIFNPAVYVNSEWVKYVKKQGKPFFNDYTFFMDQFREVRPDALIVGITGTRGKTTTTTWINHLIPHSILGGNIKNKNLYTVLGRKGDVYVLELSNFQLEYATNKTCTPNIAVFTNLYPDHLNRHKDMNEYREAKFNIFKNQTEKDVLIANYDEPVTKDILAAKPKGQLFFISKKPLPKSKNGMFFDGDSVIYQFEEQRSKVATLKNLAPHEKANLLAAMLAAHIVGVSGDEILGRIRDLPQPQFREEIIFKEKNFKIINDSAGTSPEATMAAIEKFETDKNFVLITGGTSKGLDSKGLAKRIVKSVKPENLFLLEGSATDSLIKELTTILRGTIVPYESLDEILDVVSQTFTKATIVFSPGAASFEKFKNEFDRGEKFNKLVRKYFKA